VSLPDTPLRADLVNAFASYRDGADWWQKIAEPRMVNVSELKSRETDSTSDASFVEGIPYTILVNGGKRTSIYSVR
jgi:hypothetical protein